MLRDTHKYSEDGIPSCDECHLVPEGGTRETPLWHVLDNAVQLQLEELQALDTEETGTAELDADRLAIEAYEEWMRKRKIAEVKSELGRLLNKREEAFEEWRLKTLKAKAADISGIPAPFKVNFL